MSLRRFAVPVLALGLGAPACQPSVPGNSNPQFLDYAVFDPAGNPPSIPTPNDLALQAALTNPGSLPPAQAELLQVFASSGCPSGGIFPQCGGFPNDQEVPITFQFVRVAMSGTPSAPAPEIDPKSVVFCPAPNCNLLMIEGSSPTSDVDVEPGAPSGNGSTLAIRHKPDAGGRRLWPSGSRWLAAVRGGPNGVKTTEGGPFVQQPAMYLIALDKDLTDPANQGPLPGTPAEKAAAGAQLEQLRQFYASPPQQGVPSFFQQVDAAGFPHNELAGIATFQVTSRTGPYVAVDQTAGIAPLPSDLLLDATSGKVVNNPAFCQGHFDQTTPAPSCPLSRGIATLDGFSTTAAIAAPVLSSEAAVSSVSNVNGNTVLFFELGAAPAQLKDVASGTSTPRFALATAGDNIVLQPAVQAGPFNLPPLKEKTEHAVIITKAVEADGQPLVRSTVASTLLLKNPVFANGKSQLIGIPDGQAQGLEEMRSGIAALLAAANIPPDSVAMAYTFKTQSITEQALQIAALPYQGALPDAPAAVSSLTLAQVETKYGVPPTALGGVDHVVEATVVTVDLLDPATGAFRTDATQAVPTAIPALVAIPATQAPASGAPLVVFRHGFTRGRADMLLIGGALAQAAMVTAAIDADKHGDRSSCSAIRLVPDSAPSVGPVPPAVCSAAFTCHNVQNFDCAAGSTCVPNSAFAGQGDTKPAGPGIPADLPDPWPGSCQKPDGSAGAFSLGTTPPFIAVASGNFFVSGNLFRTRDSLRQDVIDESVLVRALTSAGGQSAIGYKIDPNKVFYVGQSLGSIQGTVDTAVIPQFSRVVLNVGGGTVVDVFSTSPTFAPQLASVLASVGIQEGTPAFAQFLTVAKWVLDPADPINFAGHLIAAPLPNPLASGTNQSAKSVLGQGARCDTVVPNPTNQLLYANIGLTPAGALTNPVFQTGANPTVQWFMADTTTACPTGATGAGGASHGFLLDLTSPLGQKAQQEVAKFLLGQPTDASPVTP